MNWSQLATILWLRWRLTRNQWARTGKLNAILTMIAVGIGLFVGLGGGAAGMIVGATVLAKAQPLVFLLVWDVLLSLFLFLWMMGVVTEIQRSEAIDLTRLLHLPVSLQGVFFMNYLASYLTLSMALFLPGLLGLCLGLTWSRGLSFLWLAPLTLSFFFLVTGWTYYLRGWLIALMVNQRRRRAVIVGVTVSFILLSQLPNLYFNVLRPDRHRHPPTQSAPQRQASPGNRSHPPALPPEILTTHKYVPFLWLAYGAMSLASHQVWPAIWGSLGAFALGGLGLRGAYRSTLGFYRGREKAKRVPSQVLAPAAKGLRKTWLEKRLPVIPEEAATLALAFFRGLTRAPELKMALAMNFFMLLILGASLFSHQQKGPGEEIKPFLATATVAIQFMGLLQTMLNQFGFDRDGFRALVLLPTKRSYILLGKNLAFAPIAFCSVFAFSIILAFIVHIPVTVFLAAALQLVAAFLLLSVLGNCISIMFPYRIAIGSLKPTKMPGTARIVAVLVHLTFPVALVPIFIPPLLGLMSEHFGWVPAWIVNLFLSVLLATVAAVVYWVTLDGLGQLLERREKNILQVVTTEVE